MTPDARTLAFLKSIEASPADRVVRYALSDYLRDEGHGGWADAVRETVDKWPTWFSGDKTWSFFQPRTRRYPGYDDLDGYEPEYEEMGGDLAESRLWRDYPTFAAAMLDLWRAWVVVNRQEVMK